MNERTSKTRFFMTRRVESDMHALLLANAVERAGGTVVSIAYDGQHQPYGALIPSSRFVLFARMESEEQMNRADELFNESLP